MTGWLIILFATLAIGITLVILMNKLDWDYEWAYVPIVIFCMDFFMALIIIFVPFSVNKSISVYKSQSAYISTHQVTDPIENAAISNKKIELNDWLYEAQWSKEKFGKFSFYPESIFDLEPIQ